jgi:hypothetical protein
MRQRAMRNANLGWPISMEARSAFDLPSRPSIANTRLAALEHHEGVYPSAIDR